MEQQVLETVAHLRAELNRMIDNAIENREIFNEARANNIVSELEFNLNLLLNEIE